MVFLVAIVAFLLFGLATARHHERAFGGTPSRNRARGLKASAWTGIGMDFALAIDVWGRVFGPIAWVGAIIVGAIVAFTALNLLPVGRSGKTSSRSVTPGLIRGPASGARGRRNPGSSPGVTERM